MPGLWEPATPRQAGGRGMAATTSTGAPESSYDADYETELAALMERHRLVFEALKAHHQRETKTADHDRSAVMTPKPTLPLVRFHEKLDALVHVQGQVRVSERPAAFDAP